GFEFLSWPEPREAAGVRFSVCRLRSLGERFAVNLSGIENGAALALAFDYDRTCFSSSDITRLPRQLEILFTQVLLKRRSRLSELEFLDQSERHQLMVEWNDTHAQYESQTNVAHLIEQCGALQPDAVALVSEDEQISYGCMNSSSNQIAHHLRALGVA